MECQQLDRGVEVRPSDGHIFRIEALAASILRVRVSEDGQFPDRLLIRYGFYNNEFPPSVFEVQESTAGVSLRTATTSVEASSETGLLRFSDTSGRVLLEEIQLARSRPGKCFSARFGLALNKAFFGLGDQTRDRLNQRGCVADMWVRNVESYTPTP
ncbi:MAG: hypothetical protein AUJ92_04010 [Armatimonadetes bacterium CG2_30_59_28]|nr:DUF4968 domain-containing protein [Armatimonadota bacterium]OIO97235.1 MAG: hypothetical protein AUJ92_04010 [Armatimonadetes bacterium CG2_30_59_28]PIU65365.1 MAG: hypothetical protein COS85_09040 [Armatimonadetes bacterium CG07_land_8_20_14_0_80_59_28]PIX43033.1 MAG: hypothetical protein COZ56_08060 [Armatimonadetes bacterium CG_4_8_14_3_um_filter_58_9]PIY44092.1 MAG: hypothetical protein COZ05_09225 [Armatimonadetes bacterium CG_4_10_14_3_um_filter_59_10]PJB77615.1 MAG: hypothetical prot